VFTCFGGIVEGGLATLHATAGFAFDWPVGILHLGLQPRIGYIGIDRVTNEREFGAYTFGLAGRAALDIVRDSGFTFAIGVEPTVEVAAALGNDGLSQDSAAPLLGASAFLEVRWRGSEH
jgi:hypothetical protein